MSVRQCRRRVGRLEQRQPAATMPTLVAHLDNGDRIALVGDTWQPWDLPLPPACKVYGFDPRMPAAEPPA